MTLSPVFDLFAERRSPAPPPPPGVAPACQRMHCEASGRGNVCFRLAGNDADANLAAYLSDCGRLVRAAEVRSIVAMSPEARVRYFENIAKKRPAAQVQLLRREAWSAITANSERRPDE